MDTDVQVRTALAAHIGHDEAKSVLAKIVVYVNLPNLVKGMAKGPDAPETEAAALAVVEDPVLADALGLLPFAVPDESATDDGVLLGAADVGRARR